MKRVNKAQAELLKRFNYNYKTLVIMNAHDGRIFDPYEDDNLEPVLFSYDDEYTDNRILLLPTLLEVDEWMRDVHKIYNKVSLTKVKRNKNTYDNLLSKSISENLRILFDKELRDSLDSVDYADPENPLADDDTNNEDLNTINSIHVNR